MLQDRRLVEQMCSSFPELARVLQRIYWFRSEWDQLNWYVTFATKDLGTLSAAERHMLQEEVGAIQWALTTIQFQPSDVQVKELHDFLQGRITRLAEHEDTDFGPFDLRISFGLLGALASETIGGKGVYGASHLPYHCARLCMKFQSAIRFCEHKGCGRIFLQPRENARYCSRTCQNRQAMKDLYERKKAERAMRKKKQSTRRTRHGN